MNSIIKKAKTLAGWEYSYEPNTLVFKGQEFNLPDDFDINRDVIKTFSHYPLFTPPYMAMYNPFVQNQIIQLYLFGAYQDLDPLPDPEEGELIHLFARHLEFSPHFHVLKEGDYIKVNGTIMSEFEVIDAVLMACQYLNNNSYNVNPVDLALVSYNLNQASVTKEYLFSPYISALAAVLYLDDGDDIHYVWKELQVEMGRDAQQTDILRNLFHSLRSTRLNHFSRTVVSMVVQKADNTEGIARTVDENGVQRFAHINPESSQLVRANPEINYSNLYLPYMLDPSTNYSSPCQELHSIYTGLYLETAKVYGDWMMLEALKSPSVGWCFANNLLGPINYDGSEYAKNV